MSRISDGRGLGSGFFLRIFCIPDGIPKTDAENPLEFFVYQMVLIQMLKILETTQIHGFCIPNGIQKITRVRQIERFLHQFGIQIVYQLMLLILRKNHG